MILTAALLFLMVLMLWGIGRLRGDLLTRGPVKLALFPALIFDGLARTLSCLATATPVVGLSPWRDGAPFLVEGECSLQRLGVPLTTALRLGVLLLGFSGAVLWLAEETSVIPDPGSLQQSYELGSGHLFDRLLSAPVDLLATGVISWLMVAWLGAMVLAAGLRGRDSVVALLLGSGVYGGLEVAHWLGLRFGTFTNGWFLRRFYEAEAGRSLILLLLVEVAVLALLSAMHLIPMLVQKIRPGAENQHSDSPDRVVPHF
ncbi:MAG: hypothetical protein OSB09_07720 [Planctomycetota bacterium]|nr:hypothetical protein [Planctomycetota bacterium]